MTFLRKLFAFLVAMIGPIALHVYTQEPITLEFLTSESSFSIGIYVVCFAFVVLFFIRFLFKGIVKRIVSIVRKSTDTEPNKTIHNLAQLIVADDYHFMDLYKKTSITESLRALKIALALKRVKMQNDIFAYGNIEKTGIKCVDIYIEKMQLQKMINSGEVLSAVKSAEKVITAYDRYVSVIEDELLEIAKMAKENSIQFEFGPEKFKYNLSSKYIERYTIELRLIDFNSCTNFEKKVEMLINIHKRYPQNTDILYKLLEYAKLHSSDKYNVEWQLQMMKLTLSTNPHRGIAKYLLETQKSAILEVARDAMACIPDLNIEKLWILLLIAIEKKFMVQVRDLLRKLLAEDKTDDVFKFLVCNPEIIPIYNEVKNDNKV